MTGALAMDGNGYRPLVPPQVPDLLAMHRHGLEMMTAANRLALGWMQQAAAQHAALTRRTFEQMAETARRVASAEAPPEQAQAVLGMLADAREQGLQTAQEIAALMTRMQGEAVALLGQAMRPPEGEA
jgi:hypothetical protein